MAKERKPLIPGITGPVPSHRLSDLPDGEYSVSVNRGYKEEGDKRMTVFGEMGDELRNLGDLYKMAASTAPIIGVSQALRVLPQKTDLLYDKPPERPVRSLGLIGDILTLRRGKVIAQEHWKTATETERDQRLGLIGRVEKVEVRAKNVRNRPLQLQQLGEEIVGGKEGVSALREIAFSELHSTEPVQPVERALAVDVDSQIFQGGGGRTDAIRFLYQVVENGIRRVVTDVGDRMVDVDEYRQLHRIVKEPEEGAEPVPVLRVGSMASIIARFFGAKFTVAGNKNLQTASGTEIIIEPGDRKYRKGIVSVRTGTETQQIAVNVTQLEVDDRKPDPMEMVELAREGRLRLPVVKGLLQKWANFWTRPKKWDMPDVGILQLRSPHTNQVQAELPVLSVTEARKQIGRVQKAWSMAETRMSQLEAQKLLSDEPGGRPYVAESDGVVKQRLQVHAVEAVRQLPRPRVVLGEADKVRENRLQEEREIFEEFGWGWMLNANVKTARAMQKERDGRLKETLIQRMGPELGERALTILDRRLREIVAKSEPRSKR